VFEDDDEDEGRGRTAQSGSWSPCAVEKLWLFSTNLAGEQLKVNEAAVSTGPSGGANGALDPVAADAEHRGAKTGHAVRGAERRKANR